MIARLLFGLLAAGSLGACVTINSVSPEPAGPGDTVLLHLSNVIGPMGVEPGVTLELDGKEMPLEPDTASVVGFQVPEDMADGTYDIRVHDGIGVLEVITIIPLLRRRSDSATLVVGGE